MLISPELQQGLFNLVYFTWLHNSEVIAYALLCVLILIFQFVRPKRSNLLFFVGFLALLIQFEYVKHIAIPLQEQTLQTVMEQGAAAVKFQKLTDIFFQKLLPLGLYLFGWGSVALAIFFNSQKNKEKDTDKPESK
ncbi:hypothetical protein GYA19_02375 [Candidatus Beckwithbacteria bacterium]|nr:hypothetical protein [Candidatus Beckwithbacteria bacterium]